MTDTDKEMNFKQQNSFAPDNHHPAGPVIIGVLLVILGIILLLLELFGKRFISNFWPFLFIAGGLIFYGVYFIRMKNHTGSEGILFPGTYLVVLGLMFFILNITGWYYIRYLWPTFIFGTALSLGSMYIAIPAEVSKQRQDLLSGIKVLSIISAILYLISLGGFFLWPMVLILIGAYIIFKGLRPKKQISNDA